MARSIVVVVALAFAVRGSGSGQAVDTTGLIPLMDMGQQSYLGFSGGLYHSGSNEVPQDHAAAGSARAAMVTPLDGTGNPSSSGRIVLLSVGMSNTTQEFCSQNSALPCDPWTFMGQAAADPQVNHTTLVIVNGAAGGQAATTWDSPTDPNYDRVRDTRLSPAGVTERQVQVVWVKVANPTPSVSLPSASADAYALEISMGGIVRALKVRYPNLHLVFLSSRIYGGYATTMLNPEPYAYESGFAAKWVVQAQIDQMRNSGTVVDPRAGDLNYNTVAPWIAWGPYLWADGLSPRSDGLIWQRADLDLDGTHPAQSGEQKVGAMLLQFFLGSPFTRNWFKADADGDGLSGSSDPCPADADCDDDGYSDFVAGHVGTDPLDRCAPPVDVTTPGNPSLAWPADLNTLPGPPDSFKRINVLDLASFIAPVRRLGTSPGDQFFDVRWDLVPGPGPFPTHINVQDLSSIITLAPPMPPFNGSLRAWNGPACTEGP